MDSVDPIKPKNEMKLSEIRQFRGRLIVQRKFNGARSTCTVDKKGVVDMWSRAFSTVTNSRIPYTGKVPHIVEELEAMGLPPGTALDGEIVSFRGGKKEYFDDSKSMVGGHDLTCVNWQKKHNRYATWVVFDITSYGGRKVHDLPLEKRLELLKTIFDPWELDWIQLAETLPFKGTLDEWRDRAIKKGYEGYVVKNLDSTYPITTYGKARKPSGTWWKIVPDKMADVVVTGYELGTPGSKFQDVVGKLHCAQYDLDGKLHQVCKAGTGFTEHERQQLLSVKFPKVARVQYRYRRDDSWKLIHPSWKGFRDDKDAKECIIEELT